LDKKKVYQTFKVLDDTYNLRSIFDSEEIIKTIIENNCDEVKINKWIEVNL